MRKAAFKGGEQSFMGGETGCLAFLGRATFHMGFLEWQRPWAGGRQAWPGQGWAGGVLLVILELEPRPVLNLLLTWALVTFLAQPSPPPTSSPPGLAAAGSLGGHVCTSW